jgi:chromosome segregation ATPase
MITIEKKIKELEKQIQELEKQIKSLKKEEMEQWFKSLLNGLEIEINDDNPNSVFYKKNSKVFFRLYHDLINKEKTYFFCDYYLVWSIFEVKYNPNYGEIQAFIKSMVEKYLKLDGVTPEAGGEVD